MLGRLDDKLDDLQINGDTPKQKQSDKPSATPLMDALDDNVRVEETHNNTELPPTPQPTQGKRIPLQSLVKELVSSWSRGFEELADEGDVACMTLVAQMYLSERGWGAITYNKERGIQWLLKAADAGDYESRAMLAKVDKQRYEQYMAKKLGRQMTAADAKAEQRRIEEQRSEIENLHGT